MTFNVEVEQHSLETRTEEVQMSYTDKNDRYYFSAHQKMTSCPFIIFFGLLL